MLAVGLSMLIAGCGAPGPGTASRLDPNNVPYGLLAPADPTPTTATLPSSLPQRVYFVQDDKLIPVAPSGELGGTSLQQANDLLVELLNGPDEDERNKGYESALSTGVTATVREVTAGTAKIQIRERRDAGRPAADGPLATGQIVLTVTSVPGIYWVLLDDGTRDIQAPLPGGALAGRAVGADDYRSLSATGAD